MDVGTAVVLAERVGSAAKPGGGGAPRHQEALGGVKVEGLHLAGVPPQHGLRAGHVGRHRGPRAS